MDMRRVLIQCLLHLHHLDQSQTQSRDVLEAVFIVAGSCGCCGPGLVTCGGSCVKGWPPTKDTFLDVMCAFGSATPQEYKGTRASSHRWCCPAP
jgi:hypothetical protein